MSSLDKALTAGGDKRGTKSAALRIESNTQAPIDIRVDWSDKNVIDDLKTILSKVKSSSFQDFLVKLPNK
ncbi:MAG: DUF1028 domain-containing protein [Lentisphaeria bacterium]|nr:DUF1028 domain-containing protein [Lentisphaeria bacterium]